jgi:phage gpG-like protein
VGAEQEIAKLNQKFGEILNQIRGRQPLRDLYREVGVYLGNSGIKENFISGGRPEKWPPSKRVLRERSLAKQRGEEKPESFGQTLLRSGHLMKDVSLPRIDDSGITFGSALAYARIQNEGGTIQRQSQTLFFRKYKDVRSRIISRSKAESLRRGSIGFARTKNYTITIPARPFLVFTDQNMEDVKRMILEKIVPGKLFA